MAAKYTLIPPVEPDKEQRVPMCQTSNFLDPTVCAYSSEDFKSIFTYKSAFHDDRKSGRLHDSGEVKQSKFCWCCSWVLTALCAVAVIITAPISLWFSLKMVQEYERMIIFRLGHMLPVRGPGITMIFPCIDKMHKVDMRLRAFSVPPQQILTSDGGAVELGAEIFLRVAEPIHCVLNVQDMDKSTRCIALTSLQKLLRKYEVEDIDVHRARICEDMMKEVNVLTSSWGVEILRVEISPVKVLVQPTKSGGGALGQLYNTLSSAFFGNNDKGGNSVLSMLPPLPGAVPPSANASVAGLPPPSAAATVAQMQRMTPRHLLATIQLHLSFEMVQQFGCIYKFNILGEDGGLFYLDLKNGCGSVGEGEPPEGSSDVMLTMTVQDMQEILSGQVSAFNAYMSGRVEVAGDLRTALRLADIVGYLR